MWYNATLNQEAQIVLLSDEKEDYIKKITLSDRLFYVNVLNVTFDKGALNYWEGDL